MDCPRRTPAAQAAEDAVKVLAAAPLLPVDSEPTGEDNSSGDSSGKSTSSSSSEGEEVDDEGVRADQAMAVLAAPAQLVQEDMAFYLLNFKSQVAHIPRPGTYGDEDGEMEVSKCGLIASAGFRKVDLFPYEEMCQVFSLSTAEVTRSQRTRVVSPPPRIFEARTASEPCHRVR